PSHLEPARFPAAHAELRRDHQHAARFAANSVRLEVRVLKRSTSALSLTMILADVRVQFETSPIAAPARDLQQASCPTGCRDRTSSEEEWQHERHNQTSCQRQR